AGRSGDPRDSYRALRRAPAQWAHAGWAADPGRRSAAPPSRSPHRCRRTGPAATLHPAPVQGCAEPPVREDGCARRGAGDRAHPVSGRATGDWSEGDPIPASAGMTWGPAGMTWGPRGDDPATIVIPAKAG